MAKFDPEHATVPNTNFSDRNSAERFLECGKFRRCANLLLPLVHQPSPPVHVYVPICDESRFDRAGVAQHVTMPAPGSHTVSPMVYMTVGQWAPLISCPRKCNGYRNKYWAALTHPLRKMFRGRQIEWNRGEKIAAWTLVIAVLTLLVSLAIPEVRRFLRLEREPPSVTKTDFVIAGRVVDQMTNQALGQANLSLAGRSENYVSEDNGNFRIELHGALPENGRARLLVTKPGYAPYDETVMPTENLIIPLKKLR